MNGVFYLNNKLLVAYAFGAALMITTICLGIQWAYRQADLTYNAVYVFLILPIGYILFGIVLGIKDWVTEYQQPGNWSLQTVGLSIFIILMAIYIVLIYFPVYLFSSVETMVNSVFKSDYFTHAWGTLSGYIGMTSIFKKDLTNTASITPDVSERVGGSDKPLS